jgi:hypothetical protein
MGFEDDLRAFEKKATSRIRLFRRALILKVSARVIFRTPVDTGRARANWQATLSAPASGVIDSEDKTGESAMAAVRSESEKTWSDDDRSFFLTNNLPYIEALENGHSQQAPAGMVAITIAEFEGLAEQVRSQVEGGSNADTEF